jgi:hypothetical protein
MDDPKRPDVRYFNWDSSFDSDENHHAAAVAWLTEFNWLTERGEWVGGHTQRGMVFTCAGRARSEVLKS